jgi:hypothetical protein
MRISREAILWSMLAVATPALADDAKAKPKVTRSQTKTLNATVTAVDQENRTVTLKGADGEERTFKVGEKVRNLPQVKVGDEMITQYQEALAVYVKKTDPGQVLPSPTTAEASTRANVGDKPAASVARTTTITTTVTAIDKAAHTVTLKGPEGNSRTIKVQDPKNLEGVNIGDTVTAEYSEAVAGRCSPPQRSPPPAKTKTALQE